ncbi:MULTISPECIES: Ig-like domain-containing protein [Clostridium]|uniref:Ig-like domain-containing protein n=1 Tax=Clostridium TaxID=1485 RepID=UPI00082472B9|nr:MULTISPECIES: Ig-like domain-containing protein [Clostridium]
MNYKKITSLILSVAIISSTHSYCTVRADQISNTQNNINQPLNNYDEYDINAPTDGTPLIVNVANNSIYNSSVEPIIKINNISLNVSDIGENKAVHATLNGQPYNLALISKKNNILTLKGDKISQNTVKGQKNTLVIYSKGLNPNGTTSEKTASVNFSIDSEAPSISFSEKNGINIQDGGYYTGQINPVIKLSDNYSIANYSINLNGAPYTGKVSYDKDGNITFEGTPISSDGNYNLSINIKDSAGNTSTFSRTFILDNTAPNISISGINNNDSVNTDVTPKINIEDCSPDIDKTTLDIKKDGVSIPTQLKKNPDGSLYFNVSDEGNYSFSVTAYDKCGHSSTSTPINFVIDKTPPSLNSNFNDNQYFDKPFKPAINTENSSDFISTLTINGNPYLFNNLPFFSDGTYDVEAQGKDNAGNLSEMYHSKFTVDTIAPEINISGINNNDCVNTDVTPKINIDDCNPDIDKTTLDVKKDGVSIPTQLKKNSDGSLYFNVSDEGSYSFSVTAYDKCGHSSTSTPINFVIDKTPPSLNFNFNDGQYFNKPFKPVINTENSSDFISTLIINGKPYSINNLPFFGDGTYDVEAQGKDNAGNLSEMYHLKFTVDTIAPEINISGINNNDYVNTDVTPHINIKDSNLDIDRTVLTVRKDGVVIPVALKQSLDGSLYFNVSAEGSYSFSVTAYDKSGNSSTSTPVNFVIDKTSPLLDFNFIDGQYINKDFKPIVKTKDINDFISTLLVNGNPYLFNDLPYFHDGTYDLEAQGKDRAGNLSALYHLKFIVDTMAPNINVTSLTDNFYYNTSVNPSISVTDANLSYIKMLLNGSDYNLGEITNEGNYQLVIISKDKADNISEKTLTFVIDKTAPSISINGLTDDGVFNYFLNPYVYISDNNPLMSILLLDGHDYHGGLITEDGKHILIVEVVDKAGNVSKKVYKFFIKAVPPDIYVSGVESGKTYKNAITPKISFSKDVVDSYTSITLDGKPYNIGDEISSVGKHELIISVKDNYGNKTVKKVYFSIASDGGSTVSSKINTIIHKIIPAKTKKDTKILYLLTAAIWVVIICVAGVIIYKFKKHKKPSDSDSEDI